MKLFTIDELKKVQDLVCERIQNNLIKIEDNDQNIHGHKGLFKETFTISNSEFSVKYEIETEADGLNSERYTANVTCEGEIEIFKKDKKIQAFAVDEEFDF